MLRRSRDGYVRLCRAIITQARRDGDTDFFKTSWYELLRSYIENTEDLPRGVSGATPENMQVFSGKWQFNGYHEWNG